MVNRFWYFSAEKLFTAKKILLFNVNFVNSTVASKSLEIVEKVREGFYLNKCNCDNAEPHDVYIQICLHSS